MICPFIDKRLDIPMKCYEGKCALWGMWGNSDGKGRCAIFAIAQELCFPRLTLNTKSGGAIPVRYKQAGLEAVARVKRAMEIIEKLLPFVVAPSPFKKEAQEFLKNQKEGN